jgi:ell wall binding domain 2 (CWB2)/WD40-like Beta Propeller Repeat
MSIFRTARRGLVAVGALPLLLGPTIAHAAVLGSVDGLITADNGASTVSFYSAQGAALASPAPIANATDPVWYPDGRRIAYAVPGAGIDTMDPYDRSVMKLTAPPSGYYDTDPVITTDGRGVYFIRVQKSNGDGIVYYIASNGSYGQYAYKNFVNANGSIADGGAPESGLTISGGQYGPFFTRGSDIVRPELVPPPPPGNGADNWSLQVVAADASQADLAPDDRGLAFIREDSSHIPQLWVAQSDGSDAVQVTTGTAGARTPRWSSTADGLAYTTTAGQTYELPYPGGYAQAPSGPAVRLGATELDDANWQPLNPGQGITERIAGSNAVGTAIAASQHDWADTGTAPGPFGHDGQGRMAAQAVVLTRSDGYYDALAGAGFALAKSAPLLLTPSAALDPAVQAEIQRILAPGGTVYLLGGDYALSPAVADALTALGYQIVRFAGSDTYHTAVLIDQAMTQANPPSFVFVATGENYYDALAAGADSPAFGNAPVVLTQGTKMPAVSTAYLKSLMADGTAPELIGVGGPGYDAVENAINSGQLKWPGAVVSMVGSNAIHTALDFLDYSGGLEFDAAALATTSGWYDALSGGAMVGSAGGPLLLTAPGALDPADAAYLQANNGTISTLYVLGGTAALSPAVYDSGSALVTLPDSLGGTAPLGPYTAKRPGDATALTPPGSALLSPTQH